ncbi:MAG: alpha/beta fold hydrolase [Pseudomonadota bacterium]
MSDGITPEEVEVRVGAAHISGRLFKTTENPERAIVLHPATGVSQKFYSDFALWLAEARNAAVLTYDYRGMGMSRGDHPIRSVEIKMSDWGIEDQNAALNYVCTRFPDLPIWVVGHSLGGMYLRWHESIGRVERVITVCSGPAYFLKHPWSYMPAVIWFWFIGGPLFTRLKGYMPGKLTGLGSDLPASVYWQWRRFCLSRSFYWKHLGSASSNPPPLPESCHMRAVSMADDKTVTPAMVSALQTLYEGHKIDFQHVLPSDFGLSRIGHIRVFSKRNAATWPALIAC